MKCHNCGYENPEGSLFCNFCGKSMTTVSGTTRHLTQSNQPPQQEGQGRSRHCVSCGRSISWDASVCQYCGYDYRVPLYSNQSEPISSGMRTLLYIVSFLVPLAGIILGIVFYTKSDAESKRVGKNCLIISIVVWVVVAVIVIVAYAILFSMLASTWAMAAALQA